MLEALKTRVMSMIARAVVKSLDDSKATQKAAIGVLSGEELEDVERVQNYGFTSFPDDGAQGLALFLGGNRSYGIVIAADHPGARKKIEKGEVALYSKFGQYVYLKADGSLELSSKDGNTLLKMGANGTAEITATKIKIKNASDDLTSLLVDLLTALNAVTVNTAVGPMPFVNLADFAALKTKIMAFKE